MKRKMSGLAKQYLAGLRKYLKQGPRAALQPAQRLGRRALVMRLETLDLARIHEQALIALILPSDSLDIRKTLTRRAGVFFAGAITPIEQTHRTALEARVRLAQVNQQLRRHNEELVAAARRLNNEVAQRKAVEQAFKRSERHYGELLEQSRQMQEQLRLLSRQLLSAQEEERKKISRELHDVIAQTLTGINVRLANLRTGSAHSTRNLEQNIADTQLLVRQSVDIVHQFARELRPTVLDDLGLIPALHTFMKSFRKRTGIHVSLSAFAAVEQLGGDKRTILYRVAQEALTNVARHAQASKAAVGIQKRDGVVNMQIKDNGKGFRKESVLRARKNHRLGLLGMRERLEMVGGNFTFTSRPGRGTIIQAQIPFAKARGGAENPLKAAANFKLK